MAVAQEEQSDLGQGVELLNEGTRLILRGLLDQLEPMAEGWGQLVEMLNDFSLYEMPEMLPNGDIIIRRKVPLEPGEDGEIDL
ncbi:MAG TPA: hypothetical protein ENK28_10725 [Aliiroseovarius sp.]|nr:hypothetical protein [Aliiroseovarius sp.]